MKTNIHVVIGLLIVAITFHVFILHKYKELCKTYENNIESCNKINDRLMKITAEKSKRIIQLEDSIFRLHGSENH